MAELQLPIELPQPPTAIAAAPIPTLPELEYCRSISDSFTDFLDRLLQAGGLAFWLG